MKEKLLNSHKTPWFYNLSAQIVIQGRSAEKFSHFFDFFFNGFWGNFHFYAQISSYINRLPGTYFQKFHFFQLLNIFLSIIISYRIKLFDFNAKCFRFISVSSDSRFSPRKFSLVKILFLTFSSSSTRIARVGSIWWKAHTRLKARNKVFEKIHKFSFHHDFFHCF
jgi:hypothetical protein